MYFFNNDIEPLGNRKERMKMGLRTISDRVFIELQQGRSREDIFKALCSDMPSDAGKIAYCIASVPRRALRQKYKLNGVLFLLLVACSVLTLLSGLPLEEGDPTIFLLITTATPLLFSYFIFRFHGGVYRLAGIWFLIDLLESVLLAGTPDGVAVLKVVVLFFIVVLAFLIGRNVFPNLGISRTQEGQLG